MTEDWKKMIDSRIEKLGDAYLVRDIFTWENMGGERLRRDPKVAYALDRLEAEAKKRGLRP